MLNTRVCHIENKTLKKAFKHLYALEPPNMKANREFSLNMCRTVLSLAISVPSNVENEHDSISIS